MTTYAISDIHGHYQQLQSLLAYIDYNNAEDRLIVLGDMIDRGPDSRLVMEFILELNKQGRHVLLRGNHEEFVLELSEGNDFHLTTWLFEGGFACLQSYGVRADRMSQIGNRFTFAVRDEKRRFECELDLSNTEQLKEFMRLIFPTEHLRFMRSMPDQYESGDYMFVHEHYEKLQTERIVISGHKHLIRPFVGPRRVCIGMSNQRVCALDMDSLVATDSDGITYDCPMDIILGPENRDYYRPQMGAWEI